MPDPLEITVTRQGSRIGETTTFTIALPGEFRQLLQALTTALSADIEVTPDRPGGDE